MAYDIVFTVEYSIRSAQTVVHSLLGLKRTPRPCTKGNTIHAFCLRHSWQERCLLNARRTPANRAGLKAHR